MKKKIFFIFVFLLAIGLFFAFGGPRYLSFEYFSERRDWLKATYAHNPLTFVTIYFLAYVVVAGLSLPGALVLTIFAGGIFGLGFGTLVVSFASAVGATLAFLSSRYIFREIIERKFHSTVKTFLAKFEEDGVSYILFLRLVPVFPFFIVNLVCGLTRVPVFTFYWASQLGMLPATVLYINAGREVGSLSRASDILSPSLLFSLVLLGVFPLLAKKAGRIFYAKRS